MISGALSAASQVKMGCDEYAALVDGPVCCPPQPVDSANDLVGIACLHSCGSLMINQPKLDIATGSCLGSQVLVEQPVPKHKYCLERDNMSCCIDTKKGAAIHMSLTNNQVKATCETFEDKYAADSSTITQLDGLAGESLSSYHPKVNVVSYTGCGSGELYLNEDIACETESKVSILMNTLSSGRNLNTLSDDQQMPVKDFSLSSAAGDLLVEGDSNPNMSCGNIHAERNVKVEGVLSNILHGLPECSPSSCEFELFTCSTETGGKRNSPRMEPSLSGGHIAGSVQRYQTLEEQPHVENKTGGHIASNVQRYQTLEEQPHAENKTAFSGAVTSEVERAGALEPEHASLTEPLAACTGTPNKHDPLILDGLLEAFNSNIHAKNCRYNEDSGGSSIDGGGQLGTVELIGNQFALRRSSRDKKYNLQEPRRKNIRKGSKASGMVASDKSSNFLAAAVRRKRSCLNRDSRASDWGSFPCLLKHVAQNDGFVIQRPGSAKSHGKMKKNNIQTSALSLGSKGNVSSGPIRLKVKLGNEEITTIELVNSPVKLESVPVVPAKNGDNQLKDVKKSIICQLNSKDNHPHTEQGLELGNSSGNGSTTTDEKEKEKPRNSADDRYLNPGTSPNSEVINEVSNSIFESRGVKVRQNVTSDPFKGNISIEDSAGLVASSVRRRKGIKKDKTPQQGCKNVRDRDIFALNVDGEDGKASDVSAVMMDSGLESADSLLSKKLLTLADVREDKKIKGSKYKGRKKNKSNLTDKTKSDIPKGKGDKWALSNKHHIIDSHPDQCHIREDSTKSGTPKKYDHASADTSSGRTSEDVSGNHIASGGVGESTARPHVAWVCCDDCHKWRCIPAILAEVIGGSSCTWTCKDNQDKAFADCSIPQEKSNEKINAELEISDGENGQKGGGNHNGLEQELALPQQATWKPIKSNIFLHRSRKKQTADEIMVCYCQSSRDGKFGCGDECLNRMVNIECVEGNCPCGDLCANQQFQKRKYAKLELFRCGKKGFGLQAQEDIAEGKFLIEYVGEVLDMQSYAARQREYASKGHKHFYFMTLNGNEVIDACSKGNLGRFINHSCEPNCRTEKWIVNGEICVGLFAIRDIKKGEEVTFDYNWVRVFGAAAKKCYCGSAQCRGYIGGDPHNADIIVQDESDEEFPEPVVIYEEDEIHDSGKEGISTVSGTLDAPGENKDTEPQHSTCNLLNLEDNSSREEDAATVASGELLKIAKDSEIGTTFDCTLGNSEAFLPEIVSSVSIEKPDNLAVDKMVLDSSVVSVEPEVQEYQPNTTAKGEDTILKSQPRMKITHPSKPEKSRKFSSSGSKVVADALSIYKRSQFIDNKPKKPLESSANHILETVDAKLGELLDSAGGICKRKDASRGYLKLLVLTSASGEGSDGATIQSTRDLSMILDAILKTKSRTVLVDIINKNGLQMLHLMMKKCRGNFNKIPILRKLLKVFEFLAEKEILTSERINGDPSRPGVESFRASILRLTEHQDKKVHQIARNFRDKWIPRQFRKYGRMDWGDRDMECNRGQNYSRSLGLHNNWRERIENPLVEQGQRGKSMETMDSKGGSFPLRTSVEKELEGCSTQPSSCGSCKIRKRKSRWDQPAEGVGEENVQAHPLKRVRNEEQEKIICDDEDDAPPGFSCPAFGAPPIASSNVMSVSQRYPGPLKCPSEAPLAFPSERYNSKLPVSYGIPLNIVQEFGTPQSAATSDRWVIAPGMVFHPFPPLPVHPRTLGRDRRTSRKCLDGGGTMSMNGSSGDHTVDQGLASTYCVLKGSLKAEHGDERGPHSEVRKNGYSHHRVNFRPKPPPC